MTTDFAKLIREIMTENGLSERGVAMASGVSRTTLRQFLKGGNIEISKLEKLLVAIGYELDIVRVSAPKVRSHLIKVNPAEPVPLRPRLIRPACMELGY